MNREVASLLLEACTRSEIQYLDGHTETFWYDAGGVETAQGLRNRDFAIVLIWGGKYNFYSTDADFLLLCGELGEAESNAFDEAFLAFPFVREQLVYAADHIVGAVRKRTVQNPGDDTDNLPPAS